MHDDVLCVYITCAPSSQESQDFLKLQKVSEAVYIFRIRQLSFIRLSALCCISVRTNNYIRTGFHLTTCSLKKKKNFCGACSLMTSCPGRFTNYNYTVLFRASSWTPTTYAQIFKRSKPPQYKHFCKHLKSCRPRSLHCSLLECDLPEFALQFKVKAQTRLTLRHKKTKQKNSVTTKKRANAAQNCIFFKIDTFWKIL